jgi:tetratricopeptide (TPR) repeat protein
VAAAGGVAANTLDDVPLSPELAALAESVTPPVAVMDVTRQLRGRDTLVESFVRRFTEPGDNKRVHLLHGLGGSGKTSIAAEVARRVSAQGVTVWWVSAADRTTLVSGMHAVAQLVHASADELSPGETAGVLWRRLNAWHKPWLLVVDNADDPSVLDETTDGELVDGRGWIRPSLNSSGLVLVTSRRGGDPAQWGNWIAPHPVKMLAPADGAQVLFDHTGGRGGTQADAEALAERLGGLSLALTLAGSYLAQSVSDPWPEAAAITTFDAFRAALDEGRVDVLGSAADDDQSEERNSRALINGIWQLAVRLLESRGLPLAGPFMRLLSQFANAPVPYQLMLDRKTLVESPIFANLDHVQIRSLLKDTAHLDLVDLPPAAPTLVNSEPPVLHVHPLMRDASRRYQDEAHGDDAYLVLAARLLIKAASGESGDSTRDHRRWPIWQVLAPHAFHLLRALSRLPEVELPLVDQVGHVVDLAARYLYWRGLRSQAKVESKALNRICLDLLGVEHPRTLAARHGNAFLLSENGEYSRARAELEAVLDLRCRILGGEHADTLATRHDLGHVLHECGDLVAAQTELEAVLAARRQAVGDEHPDVWATRNNLAAVFRGLGDLVAAQAELEAVVVNRRQAVGNEHPDVLTARNNLAAVLCERGDLVAAQTELEAVLAAQRRTLGDEHPSTLAVRQNLASVLQDLGDLVASQTELEVILGVQQRTLGEEYPDTLRVRHNLAVTNFKLGKHPVAVAEMQAVLAAKKRVLGDTHPQTRLSRDLLKDMRRAMSSTNRPVMFHGPGKRKKKKKR